MLTGIDYNPNNNFDPSAPNYCFVASVAGYYQVNGHVEIAQPTGYCQGALYVNNVNQVSRGSVSAAAPGWACGSSVSDVIYLAVGDGLSLWVLQTSGASANLYVSSMSVHYLSS